MGRASTGRRLGVFLWGLRFLLSTVDAVVRVGGALSVMHMALQRMVSVFTRNSIAARSVFTTRGTPEVKRVTLPAKRAGDSPMLANREEGVYF